MKSQGGSLFLRRDMIRTVNARWDPSNRRWECSIGSGKNRRWFRSRIEGDEGKRTVEAKREHALNGVKPLKPGTLAEFVETVWWPRTKAKTTKATRDGYLGILKREIARFYGYQLDDLTLEVMQPWVSNMEHEPKTVHNIYRVLSSILDIAHKTGKYLRLDHKLVVLPEVAERWAVEGLEPENIAKLLSAAQGTIYYGPLWTAAMLGLRRNEVCGLKKGHIKLHEDRAVITVQDNRQPGIETNKLKSKTKGQARVLEVPRFLGEKLASFGAGHDGLYLFHNEIGKPIHPNKITRCMFGFCTKAEIKQLKFKDLRAACRSNLSAVGVEDLVIMQILGHSTFKSSKVYQDQRGSRQIEAFSKLVSNG